MIRVVNQRSCESSGISKAFKGIEVQRDCSGLKHCQFEVQILNEAANDRRRMHSDCQSNATNLNMILILIMAI